MVEKMCSISQRSDNLRRPAELAYRRHRCIDLAKTLAGLLSKYLTHEEPQGPIAQDCKQHPPKPGSSPARGRSLHWNRNFREKGWEVRASDGSDLSRCATSTAFERRRRDDSPIPHRCSPQSTAHSRWIGPQLSFLGNRGSDLQERGSRACCS